MNFEISRKLKWLQLLGAVPPRPPAARDSILWSPELIYRHNLKHFNYTNLLVKSI